MKAACGKTQIRCHRHPERRHSAFPRACAYKLAQQGRITCQKVGRHWRFRREAVDGWLTGEPEHHTEDKQALSK
jgi:excisionase family DNA binding protein